MYEDPRDDWTLLGLAAVAVLAALCLVFAGPIAPDDSAFDAAASTVSADEAEWIQTGQPGEQMLSRRGPAARERDDAKARQREEAELDALVRRSAAAVERSRHAATELEASVRALRPDAGAAPRTSDGHAPAAH